MDTWVWIVLLVLAIVALVLVVVGGRRARERRLGGKRVEASELREEAALRARRAEERETVAREQVDRARSERAEAEDVARRADKVDPDVET